VLAATRRSLHAVAETLLAGPQHRLTGTIRLYAAPGGFRTGPLGSPDRYVTVRGTDLVAQEATGERVVPLRGTLAELAVEADVDFGPPVGVYPVASQVAGTDLVDVDPAAAALIAGAFAAGDAACRLLVAEHAADQPAVPATPVLWPEHFDLGIALDGVNYGVSAGDDLIPEPYAYVGPHAPRVGAFWDQPFGAARLVRDLRDAAGVLTFFELGREHAATDPLSG
jgi:hypothetical protein